MNKSENSEIAVLQTQMSEVTSTLSEVRTDVKTIKVSLEEKYALKSELRSFKYVTVPLIIIVTAIITALVYYYVSHGKSLNTPDVQTNTVTTAPAAGSGGTSSTPSSTTTTTTNNTTTPPASSSSNGGLLSVPKVQVGN